MDAKDEIKERLSIVDVVSHYVSLKPAGKNFVGLSPFTTEKTPSFYVSPDRGLYYCFSTSQGGDMFTFVQKLEGLDFRGALKVLAEKAGVSLHPKDKKEWQERDVLFAIMEDATKFFEAELKKNQGAFNYLTNRGLKGETIHYFRLGFAPTDWRSLKEFLLAQGYPEDKIEKAGLIKYGDKGSYDRFRSRIMFPISDSSGRVIAFSGRIFIADESRATDDQKNAAKYLNSPDTPLFNKSDVFFGLDKAKDSIKKNNFAILVEGQMDLLMLHQSGYTNTIAASGTALTDKEVTEEGLLSHMGLVQRLTNNLLLAYDGDRAGVNATKRATRIALQKGLTTKVIQMPKGVDPADLIRDKGKDEWSKLVKNSVSVVEMLTQIIVEEEQDSMKRARRIRDEVLKEIKYIPSAVETDQYLRLVADKTKIPYEALKKDFEQMDLEFVQEKNTEEDPNTPNLSSQNLKKIERAFGLLWYLEDKKDTTHYTPYLNFLKKFSGKLYNDWEEKLKTQKDSLVFEIEIEWGEGNEAKALQEMLYSTALDILRFLRPLYKLSINRLEKANDTEKIQGLMSDFHHIIQMIENPNELHKELYGTKKTNN